MVMLGRILDLKDDFHKRVEGLLLLLPEVVVGGKVDFVNSRNTKILPAEKS